MNQWYMQEHGTPDTSVKMNCARTVTFTALSGTGPQIPIPFQESGTKQPPHFQETASGTYACVN